jgi:hypothetical protein
MMQGVVNLRREATLKIPTVTTFAGANATLAVIQIVYQCEC